MIQLRNLKRLKSMTWDLTWLDLTWAERWLDLVWLVIFYFESMTWLDLTSKRYFWSMISLDLTWVFWQMTWLDLGQKKADLPISVLSDAQIRSLTRCFSYMELIDFTTKNLWNRYTHNQCKIICRSLKHKRLFS
jgi:hypothetical protein